MWLCLITLDSFKKLCFFLKKCVFKKTWFSKKRFSKKATFFFQKNMLFSQKKFFKKVYSAVFQFRNSRSDEEFASALYMSPDYESCPRTVLCRAHLSVAT